MKSCIIPIFTDYILQTVFLNTTLHKNVTKKKTFLPIMNILL